MPTVAERLRQAYPALTERAGVGSVPANPDARNVPSFHRWRLEMKLSPFFPKYLIIQFYTSLLPSTCCHLKHFELFAEQFIKMFRAGIETFVSAECCFVLEHGFDRI
jgi:hypothetical protein